MIQSPSRLALHREERRLVRRLDGRNSEGVVHPKMDGTRRALSTLRCLATESARVVFQPEGCCRSGSGDSAAVSLRVGRHCSPRPGAARLRLPMRSDGVVFWPPRLGCTGALMCTSLARAARAGAATAGEASHQMHCRRRSTRAARGLIDYGSRVGALCCAVPGSTTSSSRRSPRRGEAQRPTTPGPRRDRRRRDIETSGDLG